MTDKTTLSTGLGWFSIALGLAQLFAPGEVAKVVGVRDTDGTRAIMQLAGGVRELALGAAILSQPHPAPWLAARVVGDITDLALLSRAYYSDDSDKGQVAVALASVAGVTVLDLIASAQESSRAKAEQRVQAAHQYRVSHRSGALPTNSEV